MSEEKRFLATILLGSFQINHHILAGSMEEAKESFFEEFLEHRADSRCWELENSIIDPDAISMIQINEVQEKAQPTQMDFTEVVADEAP